MEESPRCRESEVETAAHGRNTVSTGGPVKDVGVIGGKVGVDRSGESSSEEYVVVERAACAGQGVEGGEGKVLNDEG